MPRHPGFQRLVDTVEPGGRVHSIRQLKGGLGATVHVVDIATAKGAWRKITLRRLIPAHENGNAEAARAEFERFQLVERCGLPAPRPLLLDAEGELFGVPALCLTYIPGATRYQPRNRETWTRELAKAAARIHAVTPDRYDLSPLPVMGPAELLAELLSKEHLDLVRNTADPLLREVYDVLLEDLDNVAWLPPRLIHDDFWPGNTVFNRGRLAAVIDWAEAKQGDPRMDIAHCEMEIAFTIDLEAGLLFRAAYEHLAGPLPDLWYFQLYRGFFAMLWLDRWLVSYAETGTKLDRSDAHAKLRAFLRRALDQAKRNGP
jgi:aminoglycoside phosphotransferase (APT) family kinase protein